MQRLGGVFLKDEPQVIKPEGVKVKAMNAMNEGHQRMWNCKLLGIVSGTFGHTGNAWCCELQCYDQCLWEGKGIWNKNLFWFVDLSRKIASKNV